ncbi:MAG: threonine/serine exporter family protein [Proteobacteria bacterium]|nr:threonine/serine exporter family protein [Pseudomonadota bacterium]
MLEVSAPNSSTPFLVTRQVSPRSQAVPRDRRVLLATRLAAGLHRAGAPAHRLESAMRDFARSWDLDVDFFALPTAVFVSAGGEQLTLQQSNPGEPDLTRLAALTTLSADVLSGAISVEEALPALDQIEAAPEPYSDATTLAAFALTGASAAVVFGGGAVELFASCVTGTVAGAATVLASRGPSSRLATTVAALGVGLAITAMVSLTPVDSRIPILAGLLVLLPGFSLTVGMTELATGHHLTGSSRVLGAFLALLQLGFGVALGSRLLAHLGAVDPVIVTPLPAWAVGIALLGVSTAFTVLLRAPGWAWPRITLATFVATAGSHIGTWLLGAALAPAMGALAVTLLSNTLSRWTGRSAALTQVPGILLLVPGSLGFEAVRALTQNDALAGVQGAFSTALAATGLVGGMLLGHTLVPPDRTSIG